MTVVANCENGEGPLVCDNLPQAACPMSEIRTPVARPKFGRAQWWSRRTVRQHGESCRKFRQHLSESSRGVKIAASEVFHHLTQGADLAAPKLTVVDCGGSVVDLSQNPPHGFLRYYVSILFLWWILQEKYHTRKIKKMEVIERFSKRQKSTTIHHR